MIARHEVKVDHGPGKGHVNQGFSPALQRTLQVVKLTTICPAGALLFVEGQAARGVFLLSRGRVKLSVCAPDGKTLILRIANPGEILGVGASISGRAYEATAETLEACEISFIRQADLLRLMRQFNEFALRMAEHISEEYNCTCREIRNLVLSESATEKLARLLVQWLDKNSESRNPDQMKLSMTHEEIAQMIGTSRETVTRLFANFKKRHLIQQSGSTLVVRDRGALESLISA